jgi:hypothetical protein
MFLAKKQDFYYFLLIFCGILALFNTQAYASEYSPTGPTLKLAYNSEGESSNPVDAFMYFVPLTSPTSIVVTTELGTTLSASVTSWHTEQKNGKVYVKCDFRITGNGSYCAFYDPNEMIQKSHTTSDYTQLLEWIRLNGPCLGRILGVGQIVDQSIKMEFIEVIFNRNNMLSPVEVSIYDIPCVNGEYFYENRYNCKIARINSLTFKDCTDGTPRMTVELASVKKAHEQEGFFSGLTAFIANILNTSTPVSIIGNATMMDFGQALYLKEQAFTFPVASNFKIQL